MKPKLPESEVIAHGFRTHSELNLQDNGGPIIRDLIYTNLFVGGSDAWDPEDIRRIDDNLSAAMSDQALNNVLIQYFRGAPKITSTFKPSTILRRASPTLCRSRTWKRCSQTSRTTVPWPVPISRIRCSISCCPGVWC